MSVTVITNFDGFQREFVREIHNLIDSATLIHRGEITKLLTNRPSSPPVSTAGQVPHNVTSNLAGGWFTTRTRASGAKVAASVYTNVKYARALEFGFPENNLKARPYVNESVKRAVVRINKMINVPVMVARAAARLGF